MNAYPNRWPTVRVSAGDYLLASNDGQTLWRISSYLEDGSLESGPDYASMKPVRGKFWSIATYATPFPDVDPDDPHLLDWDRWTRVEDLIATKRDAIVAICGPEVDA